ncbi:transposon Ty3-I Gag-Pol polyprotein [Trichonephila clavipes]|nr:transposon Ty3-I Gag-Pol polyprotein [Trichonephila clavipes]
MLPPPREAGGAGGCTIRHWHPITPPYPLQIEKTSGSIASIMSYEVIIAAVTVNTKMSKNDKDFSDEYIVKTPTVSHKRLFKTKNVPDEFKGEILLNLLGEKAENILVYVKDEEISDYNKFKSSVLREFEPTPLICLQNFQKAKRMPNETHVQLASRLLTNWDQYCNLRNVNDFNSLKDLIVSYKLYETLDNETAVHINIKQEQNWFKPIQMGKECDMFYACKGKSFSEFTHRACHNQNDSRKDFKYIPPNARREALNRRFLLGVWTVNSPQSHIVRVYDAGHGKSGVFHSAEWHGGDWSSDGIRETWLWFFIWVESLSFLVWMRAKRLLSDWMLGTVNIDSDWLPRGLSFKLWGGARPVGRAGEKY